jgi:hypothetical protein
MLRLREICGVLLVWHGPLGQEPWEIAEPVADGWRPIRTKKMRFHSHPQEVTENSVDIGHFGVLHGFADVRVIEPMTTEDPYLRARYGIRKPIPLLGGLSGQFHIRADGLGFSLVELALDGNWAFRQLVLTTPTGRSQQGDMGVTPCLDLVFFLRGEPEQLADRGRRQTCG